MLSVRSRSVQHCLCTDSVDEVPFDAEKVNYQKPSFFEKFFELQAVMWRTNAGLTERHAYDSRPSSWPVLRRGIVCSSIPYRKSAELATQNFWVKDHRQVYLVGNPVVWWLSTVGVFVYLAIRGILILRAKRGFRDLDERESVDRERCPDSP